MRRLTALLLLLATACGQAADRPFTPGQAAAPTAAPTLGPTPQAVRIGPELSVTIDWPAGQDRALLAVFADLYLDSWRAVLTGDDGYLDRVEGQAAADAYAWVRGFGETTVKGVARLYALNVRAVVGNGAEVAACVDETALRLLSRRDGAEVVPRPGWTRGPYLQAAALHRGQDGWRVKNFRHDLKGCV